MAEDIDADPAFVASPSSRKGVSTKGFNPGEWFCERGDFWGTVNQLCLCAKCGKSEMKRYNEPRHYHGLFTPKLHMICDECFDALPDEEAHAIADTHPKDGDVEQAPLVSGGGAHSAIAQDVSDIAQGPSQ